jgi:flagellar motor switch protein FliM
VEIVPHDFARPPRIDAALRGTLLVVQERTARELGTALSDELRTNVEARAASIEEATPESFLAELPGSAVLGVLEADWSEARLAAELGPGIAYPMLERMLGGRGDEPLFVPPRSMTAIEMRLARRLFDRLADALGAAWSAFETDAGWRPVAVESNPRLASVGEGGRPGALVRFEITMGRRSGLLSICLPASRLEVLRPARAALRPPAEGRGPGAWSDVLGRRLAATTVAVEATVPAVPMSLDALRGLAPGSVVPLGRSRELSVIVSVEGTPVCQGRLDDAGGTRRIRVTGPPEPG